MTVLPINTTSEDMELHIEKAYTIIDKHLPFNYTNLVIAKFPKELGITSGMIRNVKKGATKRIDILNAMVEVALENKKLQEKLIKITT
jgi:hypothetical protein